MIFMAVNCLAFLNYSALDLKVNSTGIEPAWVNGQITGPVVNGRCFKFVSDTERRPAV